MTWQIVFWASLTLLAYTYAGFPLLLLLRAALLPRPWAPSGGFEPRDDDARDRGARSQAEGPPPTPPTVTVLIAAFNEEQAIERKIVSVLQSDYPAERLEVLVASDGSTDGTEAIVRRLESPQVRLLPLPRGGKAAALNAAAPQARGEVLVLTDANSIFAPDAVRNLVAPLADPQVGGVAGDQQYLKGGAGREAASGSGERSYWSIDRWLKRLESAAGNTISATGALYAVRRRHFRGVPEGVTDDFAISTDVIQQGARLVFCGEAVAYEPVAGSTRLEFGRKVRVMTRGFRAVWLRRGLLLPWRSGFYSLQLLSHKLLRRLMVFPLLALLAASLVLWPEHPLFRAAAAAQLAFYTLAALPLLTGSRLPKPLGLPFFFCLVNLAAVVALLKAATTAPITRWETHRPTAADSGQPPTDKLTASATDNAS